MNYLIVIGGATATGKSDLAVRLARHFDTVVLSADSRQFYREMSIGTAKPSLEEQGEIKHYFVDSLSVADDYSVGDFERQAIELLDQLFQKHRVVVMAGGSGLFIRAICEGLDTFPEVPDRVRSEVESGEKKFGIGWLQQELKRLDPDYFENVDRNNPARLRRALEVCLASDKPYSYFLSKGKTTRNFTPVFIQLDLPRAELYARIEQRVDKMIEQGLEEEARRLLPYRDRPALHTVGYEEFFDFFDQKTTREEAIVKIKQHTRNYAKRQGTWFRKYGQWQVFHPGDWSGVLDFVQSKMTPA